MGCGESKHVVTGNTISRKSSRAGSKRVETPETIETTTSSNKDVSKPSSMLVKEEGKDLSGGDNSRAGVAESGTTELKKEANEVKINDDDQKKNDGVLKENKELPAEQGNIVGGSEEIKSFSNGNHVVKVADANLEDKKKGQPIKLEEPVKEKRLAQETKIDTKNESTVGDKTLGESSETKPETVPETKLVEETKEKPKEDTLEDKKLAEDAKEEETVKDKKLAEVMIKEETAKGEPETVKEERSVKEKETAETPEAKVSTPDEKKEEETVVSTAADELKSDQ